MGVHFGFQILNILFCWDNDSDSGDADEENKSRPPTSIPDLADTGLGAELDSN